MAANSPVVFLAFANSLDDHLAALKEESRNLFNTLQDLQQADKITVHREESSEVDELYEDLLQYDGRIVIFHYGGHSDGSALQLEGGVGGAGGVARLLGLQSELKLVFLNGCANKEQVKHLHAAGVPAVIATTVKINDTKATLFSGAIYKSLVDGRSIFEAFDSAAAYVEAKFSSAIGHEVSFKRSFSWDDEEDENEEAEGFEWALYTREEAVNDLKQWRLPEAQSNWQTQLQDSSGPVRNLLGEAITQNHRSRLRTVNAALCKQCGTTISLVSEDPLNCSVCGNEDIEKAAVRTELAEHIVPSTLAADDARQSVVSALGLKNKNVLSVEPVYLPHWVFDLGTRTTLSAERGMVRAFDTDSPSLEWENVNEEFDLDLRNFVVPAGKAPAGRGGLGNWVWDFEPAQPLAELDAALRVVPQDQSMQAGFNQVSPYFDNEVEAEALDRIGGHQQRGMKTDTKYKHLSVRSVLLPHWYAIAETPNGKTTVIVNGQTGAVKFPRVPGLIAIDKEDHSSMSQNSFEPGGGKPKTSLMVSVYSGIGIGIMVGLLMGLAAPQGADAKSVVSIFIGAVGVLLAALLGLNDRYFSTAKGLRIGSFGLAVALSGLTGIYVRDHGLLSPTLAEKTKEIRSVFKGISDDQVIALLTETEEVETLGGEKKTVRISSITPASVMFSGGGVDRSVCHQLSTAWDDTASASDVLRNFRFRDPEGKLGWRQLADKVAKFQPLDDQKPLLFIARDAACGSSPEFEAPLQPEAESCKLINVDNIDDEQRRKAFAESTEFVKVLNRIDKEISEKKRDSALKLLAPVLCSVDIKSQ